MNALHFGAGNIGRGFIGKVLADSGVQVTFADVNEAVIDLLKRHQSYNVKIVGDSINAMESVRHVTGVDSKDTKALIELFKTVDLVTTAVGPTVLKIISELSPKVLKLV